MILEKVLGPAYKVVEVLEMVLWLFRLVLGVPKGVLEVPGN